MQFHYFLACFSVYLFVLVCSCLFLFVSISFQILFSLHPGQDVCGKKVPGCFFKGVGLGGLGSNDPTSFFQRSYWFIVLTKKWLNTLTSYCLYDIKVNTKLESSSDTTPWVSSDKKSCNLVGWKIWHSSPLFCNV